MHIIYNNFLEYTVVKNIRLMLHSHCTGTELECNIHIAQGLKLGTGFGNIMHATEIHYKVPLGNISGTEKWVGNLLPTFPAPVHHEQHSIVYRKPVVPSPVLGPVQCERAITSIIKF